VAAGAIDPSGGWATRLLAAVPYSPELQGDLTFVMMIALLVVGFAEWPLVSAINKTVKGRGFRERSRIGRLGQSGEIIADPNDAFTVQPYVEATLRLWDSWQYRVSMRILFPIWLLALHAYPAAVNASRGQGSRAIGGVSMFLVWVALCVYVHVLGRRIRRTAAVNGWPYETASSS
jgi:hypothetical protein